ncbi:hypothetical protein ACHAW5_005577 [Stephanodiscus triporus]|uniref:Uncharacterized protein n=1 Tax=Stephanodiscus triporus TaxID=2934178 RepID=A0ABD3NMZ5_9STRA
MKRTPSASSSTSSRQSVSRGGSIGSSTSSLPPPTPSSPPGPSPSNNAGGAPPPPVVLPSSSSSSTPPRMSPLFSLYYWLLLRIVAPIFGYANYILGLAPSSSIGHPPPGGGDDGVVVDDDDDDDGYNDVLRGLLAERRRTWRTTNATNDDADGRRRGGEGRTNDVVDDDVNDDVDGDDYDEDYDDYERDEEYLRVRASPGLTTLLDDALYRAYEAELQPTVSSASKLLCEFVEMKEASVLVLRGCRWSTGVPLGGGMSVVELDLSRGGGGGGVRNTHVVAAGDAILGNSYVGEGAIVDGDGEPVVNFGEGEDVHVDDVDAEYAEARHAEDVANWNEYDTIQDFAMQCYLTSREAIHRLSTDRLAESANRTLRDSIIASEGSEGGTTTTTAAAATSGGGETARDDVVVVVAGGALPSSNPSPPHQSTAPPSQNQQHAGVPPLPLLPPPPSSSSSPSSSSFPLSSPADAGIGRCYDPQPRRDCWESPRLYCPDYYWADDAICACQRLLKALSKHRFLTLASAHGWERYHVGTATAERRRWRGGEGDRRRSRGGGPAAAIVRPPTYAIDEPHVFPSLEAAHSLRYLVSELLASSIPARLNQFRAATESNAVVSKRLYLVKCEYRAPLRALWESCTNLNAAPRIELVERYLRDYHGIKVKEGVLEGGGGGEAGGASGGGGKGLGGSRKKSGPSSMEFAKKTAIQQQREKLEKLITEKYWKHPAFVEALQLERCCERLEAEMSQMLMPLANLASEIMCEWKERVRAVAVVNDIDQDSDNDDSSGSADNPQCKEVWDEEMFEAQYMDWFDMVKRQQELNAGKGWAVPEIVDGSAQDAAPTTLSELSKVIRDAEIELSIAMASKDQLERVHKRLEALRADKAARYKVLAQIVFDVGYRELNNGILVESPPDYATIEFPKLSVLGVFGEQLTLSGEVLPVG